MYPKVKKEYVCYYEGQQEEMYFSHFARLVKLNYENTSIKFKKVEKIDTLNNISTSMPKIAVFDHDSNRTEFERNANMKNIRPLYTNINFDLWLLLHKEQFNCPVKNNNDYVNKIRNAYELDCTSNIKKKENMEKILSYITLEKVRQAIINADNIMISKNSDDRKILSKKFYYYDNPSMNIHEFFKEIFKEIDR